MRYVDPFIGTDGTGHTFPGPSMPFGMVQPGPDNADRGWDFTSGYQYRAPRIFGFSQTRASGTGIPELGDLLLQPSQERRASFDSGYDKRTETARPGYYAVTLKDNRVRVELAAGVRTAFHRYTFERGGRVWVLVDTQHGLTFITDVNPVLEETSKLTADGVEGVQRRRNWTTRTIAYSLQFDRPIAEAIRLEPRAGDRAPRFLLGFDLGASRVLIAKAGMSSVDVDGARANRDAIAGFAFDDVARNASQAWEALLQRAQIEAPRAQKRTFYSALYHAFLHPSVITDVDGRWRGPDGLVRRAERGERYSTLSLWDTFRASHPLFTLLVPERVNDFVQTLIDHADAADRLPKWTIWGGETGTMIGEPALPVIADAYAKGFTGFDAERALAAMIATSTVDAKPAFAGDHALSIWSLFDRFGYYPFDLAPDEAVSRSLEAGIGDTATARMAARMGKTEPARRFEQRARAWRNLIDPQTRLARGRDSKGQWRTPFDPLTPTSPLNNPGDYTEANAWQYTWTPALHDPLGFRETMGGPQGLRAMLDEFFFKLKPLEGWTYLGQEAMIGQYAHGNEPSHHVAWLYALSDQPFKARQLVRQVAESFYRDTPNGIIGNDDAGQMSAWYVFATLGFYPLDSSSATYVLGHPLARRITLQRDDLQLAITAAPVSKTSTAPTRLTLNGAAFDGPFITHRALTNAHRLHFEASPLQ